jgi:glucose-6-phosphate 1-dehydrogenase
VFEKIKHPFVLTIFGASGDLAKLKIFPSLFALASQNRFPDDFLIIGYARSKKTHEEFRKTFAESAKKACGKKGSKIAFCEEILEKILSHVFYISGQYDQLSDFERFLQEMSAFAKEKKMPLPKTHIAYFSVPPSVFQPILKNIALSRKSKSDDIRVVLEKPFGDDEQSAKKLFHFISRYYREEQIFLLDHYLGKTSVQSILTLRHNNAILNLLLKGRQISSIQITAHEMVGVEERAGYFDTVGIIKDMFQSHLTQILAMITMSIPITADAKSFHREKEAILSALDFSERSGNVFLGQYQGYKSIPGVTKNSQTETYFAAKLKIDRESWYGVPIFVRTGKKLNKKATTAVIEFKKLPFQKEIQPNRLVFELQPREMIHIKLVNQYGVSSEYHEIATSESIACRGDDCLPEHARLLLDVMQNEKLHFLSFPEIIASWNITDKITDFIRRKKPSVFVYPQEASCPVEINKIFQRKEEYWFEV